MALPNQPWITSTPTTQDTVGVEQPDLTNDSAPGAGDGHRVLVEHVEALRDKLQYAYLEIGTNPGNAPSTSLRFRVAVLEATGGSDENVAITGADLLPGHLDNKLTPANGLTTSTLNPGANEELQIEPVYGSAANTVCEGDDSRLSDARTPVAHSTSHKDGGSDEVATATPGANEIVKADASSKVDGWVTANAAAGTPSLRQLGSGSTDACAGDDSRLSDARTPTSHASSHQSAGGDALSADILMATVGTTTYKTIQHAQNLLQSAGCACDSPQISDAGSGDIDVTAGYGFIKATATESAELVFCVWSSSLANTIPTNAIRYVGIEYNSGTPQVVIRTSYNWDFYTDFPLGTVVWDGTDMHISEAPQCCVGVVARMLEHAYQTTPYARDEQTGGLLLGEKATRYITLSAGAVWQRLSRIAISAIDTSGADTFNTYYRDGGSGWTETTGVSLWPNTDYDNNSGILQAMTTNRYANLWFYLGINDELYMLYPQAEHISEAAASGESPPSVIPVSLSATANLIGRLTFQKSATTAAQIDSIFDTQFTASGALALHASTHENGGADEMSVSGLSGVLADDQNPVNHASDHQNGGGDEVATATPGAAAIPKADGSSKLDSWITANAVAGTPSLRQLGSGSTDACAGNDSRLSDSRTPTSHASTHNAGGGDAMAIDAVAGTGSLRTLSTTSTTACAGNDSRLSDSRTPTSHASSHSDGGSDEMSIANLGATGETINTVPVADGANGLSMTAVAGLDSTAIHDNVAAEISVITEKATPTITDLIVIEDAAASNAKKKVQLGNLDHIVEGIDGLGPENIPATVNVNTAVDVTGSDLSVGVYEVTLTTDLTDTSGVSVPSDMVIGVLKVDDASAGGGTGPASITDGIPIVVWGTQKIKIVAGADDRIWFMRSAQTEFKCLVYISEVL